MYVDMGREVQVLDTASARTVREWSVWGDLGEEGGGNRGRGSRNSGWIKIIVLTIVKRIRKDKV